ncbi:hypothetical protein HDK90DRAFT_348786 [Phyllosticta capitalensis]|uniref:Uncharacterized protein n=1 Tax=Phyllosticta capitalensis TaxID=121624 RepID=A0ABR1YGN4_9PEZI
MYDDTTATKTKRHITTRSELHHFQLTHDTTRHDMIRQRLPVLLHFEIPKETSFLRNQGRKGRREMAPPYTTCASLVLCSLLLQPPFPTLPFSFLHPPSRSHSSVRLDRRAIPCISSCLRRRSAQTDSCARRRTQPKLRILLTAMPRPRSVFVFFFCLKLAMHFGRWMIVGGEGRGGE